jgi:hypothetical protein
VLLAIFSGAKENMSEDECEAVIVNLRQKLPKLLYMATDRTPHEACGLGTRTDCEACKAAARQEGRGRDP